MVNKDTGSKAVRTVSFMAVIIFCAKFLGLLRETLIATVYGQGYFSDILNTSAQIPLLFFDMTLGVAILSTFVPVFNKYLEQDGKERAMTFAGNFITIVAFIATLAALVGIVFAKPIVSLIAPGYDSGKVLQTAYLLKILFPAIIFTALAYIAVGILQSFGEFTVPSLISFVSNLIMIAYLSIFGNKYGMTGITLSMLIAWTVQLLIQIPSLKKKGFVYKPSFNLKDKGIREAAVLAIPVLISSWVQPLCVIINTAFGSTLGNGAVSGLNWANKIYIIMVGVFAYAITNFVFPRLSRLSAGNDDNGFAETTRTSLTWVIFLITFISALFIALSEPIIKVVFQHGAFTEKSTLVTSTALFYYSFGMIGYAICEVLNKSFYAIQDGKTPMFTSIFGVLVNFIMAFILVRVVKMGIGGLALASAISSLAIAVALLFMINKRKNGVVNANFIFKCTCFILCGFIACLIAKFTYGFINTRLSDSFIMLIIKLCIASLPALMFYAVMGLLIIRRKTNE